MVAQNKLDKVLFSYTTQNNSFEDENQLLRETVSRMEQELHNIKSPALMVCEVISVMGKQAIIKIPNGNSFYSNIAGDCEQLLPSDQVLVEQKNLNVVKKITFNRKLNAEKFVIIQKPTETWADVGGLSHEVREVQEVVELPLIKPELFKRIGIKPPKGLLLYGPPGTGKTLLAKAVATSTNATFIQVAASELVQKFIGEGAKLIKEIFELAKQKAPSIIFIDELDALASQRMELGTSGEREVNRTFMQLLAEIDGFKPLDNVKIIGATNRKDILDEAIIRPGRLDRLIYVGYPNVQGRVEILKIHLNEVKTVKKFDLDHFAQLMDNFSGAEIRAAVTEAGYFAIRDNRSVITKKDLEKAITKVKRNEEIEGDDYMHLFG